MIFLAILPDLTTAIHLNRRVHATRRKYDLHGHPISPERLHISLLGFGDYELKLVETLRRKAGTIQATSFEVSFDQALSFKHSGKKPFVLIGSDGLAKLREFAHQVSAAFDVKLSSFNPHLTLIWDEKLIEPHKIRPVVSWTVQEFVLIKSFVGESRYEILGRWPLLSSVTQ